VALGHDRDERWLCPLPLSHVGGLMVLLRSVIDGTTAVLGPAERDDVTIASLVPTQLARLLDREPPPGLRVVMLGGAPADPTLLVRARDAVGRVDATPASWGWTVDLTPPDTTITSAPADSTTSTSASFSFDSTEAGSTFQCSVDGGAWAPCSSPFSPGGAAHRVGVRAVGGDGQVDETPAFVDVPADADHDDVPDRDDPLPPGNLDPVVGRRTIASADAGTVLVKLPEAKEFVPFAGAASLPVGSIVDARKGTVTLKVASNGYAKSDRRHRDATVTLSAGIFEIRQARMRKGVTGLVQIPLEIVLRSAPGAEVKCRSGRSLKGVVRRLTATGKGVFRVTGGASRADAGNASFTTADRCDGTLTRVLKGRAKVRAARRAITVRQGHRYFAKARLFTAKKGRKSA
jgi:hypothetical protein